MASPAAPRPKRRLVTKTVTVPGNLRRACDEFNTGRFFECHETLEEIWQQDHSGVRDLYKALIQVAAAFVHITRPNHFGADRLTRTALGYFEPYRADGAMGFDVETIASGVQAVNRRVNELGRARIAEYDLGLRPTYTFDESLLPAEALRWHAWGFDASGRTVPMEITVVE